MARPPHQATESGLGYSYEQAPDKWGHWLQSHAEWSAAATAAAAAGKGIGTIGKGAGKATGASATGTVAGAAAGTAGAAGAAGGAARLRDRAFCWFGVGLTPLSTPTPEAVGQWAPLCIAVALGTV